MTIPVLGTTSAFKGAGVTMTALAGAVKGAETVNADSETWQFVLNCNKTASIFFSFFRQMQIRHSVLHVNLHELSQSRKVLGEKQHVYGRKCTKTFVLPTPLPSKNTKTQPTAGIPMLSQTHY